MPPVRSSRSIQTSLPIIGISGGVGSGKSTVVRHVSRLRLHIIDADRVAHELLKDDGIIRRIQDTFGQAVIDAAGLVDRRQLAERVFGSTETAVASESAASDRKQLEQILHPAIHQEIVRQINSAPADTEAVILDAALLLEVGWAKECDAVVFVDTPLSMRQQRVLENRNWSAKELARREAAQWPIEQKRAAADFVIDNSGSVEAAAGQMERALRGLLNGFSNSPNV